MSVLRGGVPVQRSAHVQYTTHLAIVWCERQTVCLWVVYQMLGIPAS